MPIDSSSGATGGFAVVTRRRWLKWTLGLGGLVGGGGALGLWRLRGNALPVAGLRLLNAHEHRTMKAIAATLVPKEGPFPIGADDFDLARAFDEYLADEPPENISDLRSALLLVEYGPVLFQRRLVTFSNLDPAARKAHWDAVWAEGSSDLRRKAALAFRKFVALVFYDHASVWLHIGYRGPAVKEGER